MSDLLNPDAKTGHNVPPDPLMSTLADEVASANAWLKGNGNLDTWDADTAVRCAALYDDVSKAWTALDNRRLEERRDFLAELATKYNDPLGNGENTKAVLTRLRTGWLQREDARIKREAAAAAERAKKLADEAARILKKAEANRRDPLGAQLIASEAQQRAQEAQAEADAAPTRAQIRGGGTRTVGLKTKWDAEITDPKLAFRHYKGHPLMLLRIQDTMLELARKDATSTKDEKLAPAGVKFFSTTS